VYHYGSTGINTDNEKLGNWKENVEIPSMSLEELKGKLHGAQQKLFLRFMRKRFQWQPG
jgi:hypothetical protein